MHQNTETNLNTNSFTNTAAWYIKNITYHRQCILGLWFLSIYLLQSRFCRLAIHEDFLFTGHCTVQQSAYLVTFMVTKAYNQTQQHEAILNEMQLEWLPMLVWCYTIISLSLTITTVKITLKQLQTKTILIRWNHTKDNLTKH